MNEHNPPLDDAGAPIPHLFGNSAIDTDLGMGYGAMAVLAYLLTGVRWRRVLHVAVTHFLF
jgi:hypothetical protein